MSGPFGTLHAVAQDATKPVADLLDVQFNEDGTATDLSARQMTVEAKGEVATKYSKAFKRYVATFDNPYAGTAKGYFKIDFENDQEYRAAIADGHSMEVLLMAKYSGAIPNSEAKPFTAHEGGGTGFLISTISGARQNEITFLPNVTTSGGSTWRWATSGVTPLSQYYYHVVGVYSKEDQKAYIYVNGELKNTVDAPGDFKFANAGNNWFAIGGDPSGGTNCTNSWPGDIVLARVYDKPLVGEEVALLYQDVQEGEDASNLDAAKNVLEEGKSYLTTVVANQDVMDTYQSRLNALEEAIASKDMGAIEAASVKLNASRIELESSAKVYNNLKVKVDAVKAYLEEHPDISGEEYDLVTAYMNTEVAPGDVYPRGSFLYIWKTHTLTSDEVKAEIDWLQEKHTLLSALAAEKPIADLLDVQFNEDGTAVDVSARQMTVENFGESAVVYSDAFQRNIASFNASYAGNTGTYFKVDFENDESFRAALADGHSMETIIMARYDGTIPNSEAKPFSAMEGGGTGFLISTISGARQNEITFLPNVTTNGSSTWRWTTSGVTPEPNVYYHVVGVWNKEEEKAYIYINGKLMNTVDAPGELKFANGGNNWFAIGGDPSGGTNCANSWPGNIAIARVYDKPLNAGEVALLWKDVKEGSNAANNELYYDQLNEAREFLQDLVATQSLIDEYQDALDLQQDIVNGDAEGDAQAMYNEIKALRVSLNASANAYAKYLEKVNTTKEYLAEHDDFAGDDRDYLEAYLNDSYEPDEDYPNGTFSYIWENHTMTTEEITAETEKVATMLSTAIENGYIPGTEITNMLTNPTFEGGFSGWQGDLMTSSVKNAETGITGAETWAKNCNMLQTLEGLENGVYVLTLNGAYRPFNDRYSTYQNAQFYVNENKTFLPTVYETYLPADEAVDGQNCYLSKVGNDAATDLEVSSEAGELLGYAIHGCTSIANAANAGRAQNILLANVTDGKLTIGFKNVNNRSTSDWMGIANLHLYFAGSLDQADHYLTETLAGMAERAQAIIDMPVETGDLYAQHPNCPQSIKDDLAAAIASVESATAAEQKYELIGTFTRLFDTYLEGREAYVKMIDEAEYFGGLAGDKLQQGVIGDTEYDEFQNDYDAVYSAFETGSYSIEEAQELTILKRWSETLEGEFVVPTADLLDIVFNGDGSAKDVSPRAMQVTWNGNVSTYYNEQYKRYTANFQNPWAGGASTYYRIDYENDEEYRAALADGHTLEMLIMADYDGTIANKECKPFSAMQAGGLGFLISTISGSRQNEITFLPNVTTTGGSTWRWTTSGVVPQAGVYYHVVGVWNKEDQKASIYVNGELKNTIDAPGELHFASAGCNWFCIGGDPSGASSADAAWCGDVVLARVYDQPLDRRQAQYLWNHVADGTENAIENVEAETPAVRPTGIYTINGIRVEKTEQGLYIINGKKILVK